MSMDVCEMKLEFNMSCLEWRAGGTGVSEGPVLVNTKIYKVIYEVDVWWIESEVQCLVLLPSSASWIVGCDVTGWHNSSMSLSEV